MVCCGQIALEECEEQQALFSDQEASNNLSLDSASTVDIPVEEEKKESL